MSKLKQFEEFIYKFGMDGNAEGMNGIHALLKENNLTSERVLVCIDEIEHIIKQGNLINFEEQFRQLIEKYND